MSLTSKLLKGSLNYLLIVSLSAWFCIVGLPAIATGSIPYSTARQTPPIPSSSLPNTDEPSSPFLISSTKGNQTSGESLEQQAKTLYESSRFSEASQLLEQALQGYQNQRDTIGQAVVLSNLALSYQQLGMWEKANQAIAQAFTLLKQSPQETPERSVIWAQALDVQGNLQLAEGKAAQAVDSWKQATHLYTQLEKYNRATRSQINQAQALQALGLYRQARLLLENLQKTLNSQQPDAPSLSQAENLRSLGEALRGIGRLTCTSENSLPNSDCVAAREVLQESLKLAQKLQSPVAIASANLSLGNVAWDQSQVARQRNEDNPDKCQEISLTNEALDFYQKAMAAPIRAIQTQAQLNILRLLVAIPKWKEAQTFYPQIPQQIANLPPGRSKIYAQVNFAVSLRKLKTRNQENKRLTAADAQEINQILVAARQEAERLQDVRSQALVLQEQGQLYQHTQQLSTAQNLTRQALNLSQSINASEISYQVAWQLGRILKEQDKTEAAIAAYWQAYEDLKSVRGDLVGTNPDVQFSFRERVKPVYRELVDLLLQASASETASTQKQQELLKPNLDKLIDSQQDKLKKAREVLDALQVAELQNYFQQACEDVKLELDNVVTREAEKGQKAAVIYPIILEDRLEIILKLPGQEKLYQYTPVKASRNRIEETLNEFQNNLRDEYKFRAVRESGKKVYDWLIKPFRDRLEESGSQSLIFILDDALRMIPMSALYDGNQFLVENYSVVLVLGLEVRDPTPLNRSNMKVLAASLTDPPKGFEQYAQLPNVNPELDQIEKAGVSVRFIRDEKFTKEAFNKTLNQENFQVVHLATHGQFGADPNDTYILTADGQIKLNKLDQIFRTLRGTKAVDLLVLSACRTATGNDRAVLGIAGTAVKAGARSAIAGLWSLADEPSPTFTQTLYKYLGKPGITRSEALRRAQLALLESQNYFHPRYWAPYVLVGSWL